jgi:hypothetical protein
VSGIGPLKALPLACTLTPSAGQAQVERWHAFDVEYALGRERTHTSLIIRYTRTDNSAARLRELVAVESTCCAFVSWTINGAGDDLRLAVTGSPEQLDALNIT